MPSTSFIAPLCRLIAGACVICAATLANGQSTGPSFDCAKAGSQAEELVCDDTALSALDRRMAEFYAAAVTAATDMQADNNTTHDTLRATQRGWIKGRDDCWKADDLRSCVEAAYLIREGELVSSWMLQPPQSSAVYRCEDTPANEVTVFFFETQLPSIRVEYGDSIASGHLDPAASGSKYNIAFGGVFWAKGGSAQFEWEQGKPMSCVAIED